MSGSRTVSIRMEVEDAGKTKTNFEEIGVAGDQALSKIAQASQRAVAALSGVTDASDAYARRAADVAAYGTALDHLRAKVDPLFAASKRYEGQLADIADAERLGAINAATAARVRDEATRSYAASVAPINAVGSATTALTSRTGAASMAMRNLGIQSIDVFQQLASGAPVMMTLIQQGGQVGQMAAVTGTSLGTLAKEAGAVALRFAPWIAATATVAGLGYAIYSVLQRSSELDGQQRALSVAIRGVGRDAELSSGQLQGYVTALKQQGVAAADAVKSVSDLARNSGLSSGMIGRIAGLAPDAAAALGQGVPETMKMLAEGAKGTAESINKLDDAFNLLNATEAAQVRTMLEHGDKAGALGAVFDKLNQRVTGLNRDALSPMEQAFRNAGNSWDRFMDGIARSEPVMKAVRMFAATLNALSPDTTDQIQNRLTALRGEELSYNIMLQSPSAGRKLTDSQIRSRLRLVQAQIPELESRIGPDAALQPPQQELARASFATQAMQRSREVDRLAASIFDSSNDGQIAKQRDIKRQLEEELAGLTKGTEEYASRSGKLNAALEATKERIRELTEKAAGHRTGLEKLGDTYDAQIRAANELTGAYGVGRDEVARVLAQREAETKVISDGLAPSNAKYAATVADLTEKIVKKNEAEARSKVAETIRDVEEANAAQRRLMDAYDGSEASIRRVREEEAARAAVIKDKLYPGMVGYTEAVERLAKAYAESGANARQFQLAQSSVQALWDTFGTALDRIGQGLTEIFLSGSKAAVSFASIARAAIASIATRVFEMAAVNPIINMLSTDASRPTLWAALGAFAGGGGGAASGGGGSAGGGLLSGVSQALSLGRISDALGFSNFGAQLSGAGEWLGLTGSNGLFSGIGNGISSFLGTSIWGATPGIEAASAAQISSAIGPGGLLSQNAVAGNMGISNSLGSVGTTFGSYLGGLGLGFGAGSLAGGFLQSSMGKTGPGPQIGAGIGAAIGSFFGPIGGLAGGLIGGAAGSLFGPGKKNAFSSTGLTLGDDGLLSVGKTFSQIVNTSEEVSRLKQQVAAIDQFMSENKLRITNTTSQDEFGQTRINGANSNVWMNIGQSAGASSDLFSVFNELRFSAANDDRLNGLISGRSFSGPDQLADFTTFVNDTMTALEKAPVSEYANSVKALNDVYDAAIAKAKEYTVAEGGLVAERDRRLADINARRDLQSSGITAGLQVRYLQATGKSEEAAILAFDTSAAQQRMQLTDQLLALGLDGTEYAAERLVQIEKTLAAERIAVQEQYADRTRQVANSILGGLTYGGLSPLAPEQRYFASLTALNQARQALTEGGSVADFASVAQQVLPVARDFLGTSERYAALVADVASAVASSGGDPAGLSSLLQAQVEGTDALKDVFSRYGDQQYSVANATLSEIKRLASAIEALMARSVAA